MNSRTTISLLLLCMMLVPGLWAQQTTGTLRGQVTDESGAVIPAIAVTVTGPGGVTKSVTTGADGSFTAAGLAPGNYRVRVSYPGFAIYQSADIAVSAGHVQQLSIAMKLAEGKQEVTVQGEPAPQVSTEPDNNATALVLKEADLEALPDDPDDLANELQALAGPSAGPSGGQIYIDGFTGTGRLPPKESIREIRINQNPFSAEYDHLGFGRIEILTKPGSDKFHGQAFFNFSDGAMNSRNPYASNKPYYQSKFFGGSVSGPISKKSSFFVNVEKRNIDDNAVIDATTVDPTTFALAPISQAVVTPNYRTTISPRIDYQLSKNNTLTGRYMWSNVTQDNTGLTGGLSLLSKAYNTLDNQHRVQLTETAVLGAKAVNETRFQYLRMNVQDTADNTIPAVSVLGAFNGGGAQIGKAYNTQNHYEWQNYTTITEKAHVIRFGVRVRTDTLADFAPSNFGGTFTFGSLTAYQKTLMLQAQGLSMDQIRAQGGGATQFTIAGGKPLASVDQTDIGAFVQDDWRVKRNFTLSLGLRYETQTNIHDWRDLGPRVGFAWAPGGGQGRNAKTVIRGGFGTFYDRIGETDTLQQIRFNGVNQQSLVVQQPNFFGAIPPLATLAATVQQQAIWKLDSHMRAPYIVQSALGIERQLPWNTTIATTFTQSHGIHMLMTRNINSPLPGTWPQGPVYPYGAAAGNLYDYESNGIYNQKQWMTNVNSRVDRNISIFTFYTLNFAKSNTDGGFPSDPFNLAVDYARAQQDMRQRFVLGGSIAAPWGFRFSPFVMAHSGQPFNVTTGQDLNGDSQFNDRPAYASNPNLPLCGAGVLSNCNYMTPWGLLNPNPKPGDRIIPRNLGEAPGAISLNMRLSRTFGFGAVREGAAPTGDGGFHGGGDHGGGPRGGGGMRMGGGPGGMRGMWDGGSTNHRYNLTLGIGVQNLLNHVNPGMPIGVLTSPLFLQSNGIQGGFGPNGAANNRRVEVQLRFGF